MKKNIFLSALILLALALTACSSGTTPVNGDRDTSAAAAGNGARYIVVMNPNASTAYTTGLLNSFSVRPDRSFTHVFNGFAGTFTNAEVGKLKADPNVRYVEPDLTVSIVGKPGGTGKPGGGGTPTQQIGWGVDRIDAEKNLGPGGSGVTVAVIDTGIEIDHPDLAGAYLGGINYVKSGALPDDDNGHGTHVAGIIAARDNNIGYLGVAPQASLVAVKVLDRRGSGYLSWVIAGID